MSALLPIATAKADFRIKPCPLYPQKRIFHLPEFALRKRISEMHHSLVVETGRLGFESSQTGGTVKRRNGLRLTSNSETPCSFVTIGKMLRPITEKRVYDCREPLPLEKVLGGGPRFLVAGGAAHLPPKADMCCATRDVCFGPIADSCSAAKKIVIRSHRRRRPAAQLAP